MGKGYGGILIDVDECEWLDKFDVFVCVLVMGFIGNLVEILGKDVDWGKKIVGKDWLEG